MTTTSRIGALQWSRLSAVAHVTWFGLQSALLLEDRADNAASGLSSVPVGADSSAVSIQALCVVRALRQAASAAHDDGLAGRHVEQRLRRRQGL